MISPLGFFGEHIALTQLSPSELSLKSQLVHCDICSENEIAGPIPILRTA